MSEKREFTLNDIPLSGACLGMRNFARLADGGELPSVYVISEKKRTYVGGDHSSTLVLSSPRRPYEPPTIKSSSLSPNDNTALGDDNAA